MLLRHARVHMRWNNPAAVHGLRVSAGPCTKLTLKEALTTYAHGMLPSFRLRPTASPPQRQVTITTKSLDMGPGTWLRGGGKSWAVQQCLRSMGTGAATSVNRQLRMDVSNACDGSSPTRFVFTSAARAAVQEVSRRRPPQLSQRLSSQALLGQVVSQETPHVGSRRLWMSVKHHFPLSKGPPKLQNYLGPSRPPMTKVVLEE